VFISVRYPTTYKLKIDVQCLLQVFSGGGDEIKLIQFEN